MDCSLRIKSYPSKFFNKVISAGIIVRVSEYTPRGILKFFKVYCMARVLLQHHQTELQ